MSSNPEGNPAKLTSLADIPSDPNWRFPSLTFDDTGYPLPPEWLDDLKTEEQRKAQGPLPDTYAKQSGKVSDSWNFFALENWDIGDQAIAQQVFEQNNAAALMTIIRGH
jgi:hypothetical protein